MKLYNLKKITEYKSKLNESQNIINQLTVELKLREQQVYYMNLSTLFRSLKNIE